MTNARHQSKTYQVACARCYGWNGCSLTGCDCREAGGQDCLNAFGNKFIHERRQTREFVLPSIHPRRLRPFLTGPEVGESVIGPPAEDSRLISSCRRPVPTLAQEVMQPQRLRSRAASSLLPSLD